MTGWLVGALAMAVALWSLQVQRRRARLVARAVHEVRGPLQAARLAVASARRDRGARDQALRAADRELARAGALLADLALAPAGGRVADAVETVDVALLLRRAAGAWRPAARQAGRDLLVVAPGLDLRVRGDAGRLQQALSNLLANAIEHGRGLVVLGARADGAVVRLEVCDAGAAADDGLGDAAPPATGPARPGRGHGLAITADIATHHGGRLVAADGRYALELPLERPG